MTGIQRIAIIGAGPTGVACAKYLVAENAFQTIDVFEQRDNAGGIWNLSEPIKSRQIPIPQTNPSYGAGSRLANGFNSQEQSGHVNNHAKQYGSNNEDSLEFESPLYDYLETNIPKTMMAFSDAPFSATLPLYPGHADVLEYLEEYAAPVRHLIHFHTQVIDVQLHQEKHATSDSPLSQHKWYITTRDLTTSATTQALYDAVVVANGHYTVPHVPDIPGIAAWNKKYPNTIIHSKAYRRPEDFKNQRVMVIGNSASGLDIAGQIAPYAQNPVYLVSRSASQLAPSGTGPQWRKDIPEIVEFLVDADHHRSVRSKDGQITDNLDAIIFATGYFYSFPFISSPPSQSSSSCSTSVSSEASPTSTTSTPSNSPTSPNKHSHNAHHKNTSTSRSSLSLTTTGLRTHAVYQHFLSIPYPTLALPTLNLKIIPFPLAENQAAVLSRLWSGRLDLPSPKVMRDWETSETQRLLKAGRLRPAPISTTTIEDAAYPNETEAGFHTLLYPEDAVQINNLYTWASSARRNPNLPNDGTGKLGTYWGEYEVWLRGQFADVKAAFVARGSERGEVRGLGDLGGRWTEAGWKKEKGVEKGREGLVRDGVEE